MYIHSATNEASQTMQNNNTVRTLQNIISSNDAYSMYNNNSNNDQWGQVGQPSLSPSRNQAPIGSEIKRNTTPSNAEYFGMSIQRAISAPPIMEVDTNNLFATQSRYSHLFGDIRCESDYANFYNSYSNKDGLPTPLDNTMLVGPYDMFGKPQQYGNNHSSTTTAPQNYIHGNAYHMQAHPMEQQAMHSPFMNSMAFGSNMDVNPMVGNNGGWNNGQKMVQQPPIGMQPSFDHLHHQQMNYGNTSGMPPLSALDQQRLFLQSKQQELNRQQQQLEYNRQQLLQQQLLQQQQNNFIQKPTPLGNNGSPSLMQGNQGVFTQAEPVTNPPLAFNAIVASNMVPQANVAPAIVTAGEGSFSGSDSSGGSPPTSVNGSKKKSDSKVKKEKKEKEKDVSSDDEKSGKKSAFGKLNSMSEAVGKIYKLAKDQYGCRFLQKKIADSDQNLQMVFDEIYDHIVELMTDPFGNYLCQKLVEYCTDEHKTLIIRAVSKDLIQISMNMHGTRAVQKLIECLTTQDQIGEIIEALKDSVVPLIKDLNGNHVIQRCLQQLSAENKQFIYNAVAGRCVEVATHKHGCCVLQRCIDHASESQKMMLIKEVIFNASTLVQNPFGNYVVQYVLDLGDDSINEKIIGRFYGSITQLSTNKFSSNVMEKCLRIGNEKVRDDMIEEILEDKNLKALLEDSFGNYVVQTAISISSQSQFQRFTNNVKPYLAGIKNAPYYKKLESKLNRAPKTASPSPKGGNRK